MRVFNSRLVAIAVAIGVACSASPSQAQVNTQKGATLGGLAGAAIGTAIGDHNGEAGAGAAIGGVLGAVTGGLLGNAQDKQAAIDRQNYYYQQQQRQLAQQQQQIAQLQSAVSMADIVSMTRTGLGDSIIINQINQRGFNQQLTVPDIITLHQQGVSEHVITALQTAPHGAPRVAQAPPVVIEQPVIQRRVITPAPVIIQEHHIVPHYGRRHYHYGPPQPRYRSSFNIRF